MKSAFLKLIVAIAFLASMMLPAAAQTVQSTDQNPRVISHTPRRHTTVKRRTKKKSAMIIGGSGLAGAGVGALVGGKKGAVIGGLAGAGGGYVYDRKSQQKPVIPK